MNIQQLMGIRGRLFLAFAVLSAFTLFASIVGWVSHNRLAQELDSVVKGSITALQLMAEIKERGVLVTITAPTLLAAKKPQVQIKISRVLDQNITAMVLLLPKAVALIPEYQIKPKLNDQFDLLKKTIENLGLNVNRTLEIQQEKNLINRQLRWSGSVFLSDIDSLRESMKKKLYSRFDQDSPSFSTIVDSKLQIMYRMNADVNLLINLLDRAQYVLDLNSLVATKIHSDEVILRVEADLAELEELIELSALKNTIANIVSLVQAEKNIFDIRRDERVVVEQGVALLAQTYQELDRLNVLLNSLAKEAQRSSNVALKNAQVTINAGRVWMVTIVAGSLLFSILIVWLYVGRNMVARITNLDAAMRAIANGNLDQQVLIKGRDEIGAMARSLEKFRKQLSNLQEELVQAGKLAALGQLSAGIAHEINQPLSAIRHYAHNGERLIATQRIPEAQENLLQISNLTKRAITIIKRLKSLAKDEQLNFAKVEIGEVINSALEVLVDDKLLEKNILNVIFINKSNLVKVDPIQLEQVFINLLTNALDSIEMKDDKRIVIECMQTQDHVEVYVKDNGLGISKEIQEKIFDPFFTTKTRGQSLGLGLSISYNIVKNFNGKLSVVDSSHTGTSFCIQLPRVYGKNK